MAGPGGDGKVCVSAVGEPESMVWLNEAFLQYMERQNRHTSKTKKTNGALKQTELLRGGGGHSVL